MECICVARDANAVVEKQILDSIVCAVQDFVDRNSTQYNVQVEQMMKRFQKKATGVRYILVLLLL